MYAGDSIINAKLFLLLQTMQVWLIMKTKIRMTFLKFRLKNGLCSIILIFIWRC